MKGDFSRLTFDPKKHFSSVRMQQGRVQLDADWNEQLDVTMHRLETEITDFVGPSGVPADAEDQSTSFEITVTDAGDMIMIGPGRCYVAGKLFENETQLGLTEQPDYPGATLPEAAGRYLVYLDAWQRHITSLEDPGIRESALGGPDTATRIKNVWQVRVCEVDEDTESADLISAAKLSDFFARKFSEKKEEAFLLVSTGAMQARMNSVGVTLENQLYRVEVHTSGSPQQATFKWSRDNGSVAARVAMVAGRVITIDTSGGMPHLSFAPGQWVELSTPAQTLQGEPGLMVRLQSVQGNELTVVSWPEGGDTPLATNFEIVRRWDSPDGPQPLAADAGGWILLEDEIEVKFAADGDLFYKSGDYWLIPARYLTGDIDWPRDETGPLSQPPRGIRHYTTALALLDRDKKGQWTVITNGDLRTRFKPITVGLLSKAGDIVEGSLRIVENLQVDGVMSGVPDRAEGLVVEGDLTIRGNLNVSGEAAEMVEQQMSGDVVLGDSDESSVTIYGTLRTRHSSNRLQVGDPLHLNAPLTVSGITMGDSKAAAALDIQSDQQLPLRVGSADPAGTRLTLENTSTEGRAWELVSTGANSTEGAGHLLFSPGNLLITRAGNVGIGTTELPGAKLEVNGSFKASSDVSGEREIWLEAPPAPDADTADHRGVKAPGDDASTEEAVQPQNATGLVYRVKQNPASGDPIFQVRSQGQAVRFFVEHDGWTGSTSNAAWFGGSRANYFASNVGIGTASPGAKLAVSGGKIRLDGSQQIIFTNDDTSNNLKLQLWGGYGLGINDSTLFYAANGRHSWRDKDGATERMFLTTAEDGGLTVLGTGDSSFAGNVGIGMTEPGGKLDIGVTGDGATVLKLSTERAWAFQQEGTGSGAALRLRNVSGLNKALLIDTNGVTSWRSQDGTTTVMTIDHKGGNIGIGATNNATPLSIRGNGGEYDVGITQNQVGGTATMELTTADESENQATRLLLRGHSNSANIEFYRGGKGSETVSMFIQGEDGNVGIGTTSPTQAKLVVSGSVATQISGYGYLNRSSPTGKTDTTYTPNYSIWCSDRVAASEFNATSDGRIKNVIGVSDRGQDLELLNQLQVTDFTFIDVLNKGHRPQKKLIAQQVQEVYPGAVSTIEDFTPNVYEMSVSTIYDPAQKRLSITTAKAHNFAVGDTVRLIDEGGANEVEVLAVADGHTFTVKSDTASENVFVYGKQVDDFLLLDYEAIAMLNVSATQELTKRLLAQQARIERLEDENATLKTALTAIQFDTIH